MLDYIKNTIYNYNMKEGCIKKPKNNKGYEDTTEYTIYFDGEQYIDENGVYCKENYQIKFVYNYNFGYTPYNLLEKPEEFSSEEIDAINYLFLGDELKMNALSIHFAQGYSSAPMYAVFAEDGRYLLGIYYFDPNEPYDVKELQYLQRFDYVEKFEGNYWIVMRYRDYY
jgi:hypothetical protein